MHVCKYPEVCILLSKTYVVKNLLLHDVGARLGSLRFPLQEYGAGLCNGLLCLCGFHVGDPRNDLLRCRVDDLQWNRNRVLSRTWSELQRCYRGWMRDLQQLLLATAGVGHALLAMR